MQTSRKPHLLVILDGFGHRTDPKDNAVLAAATPNLDRIRARYPHGLISGSGEDVGLPDGQMGNSEVGHMNLGAGRVLYQDFTRISKAIREGSFFENEVLVDAIEEARSRAGTLNILGLLSPGGVHSHEDHIFAMAEMGARMGVPVQVHAFLDGRDTPPKSAAPSLERLQQHLARLSGEYQVPCHIATLCGRYYAMDRDERWDRVEKAYNMLTAPEAGINAESALTGLQQAYDRGETDEFVQPAIINGAKPITDGDAIVFMNFRADRARELTRAFTETDFKGFVRKSCPELARFVMLTRYSAKIDAPVAFMPENLTQSIGEYLADLGKTQLRIAETEKYAHVTFFFSGGREEPYTGEERILIRSPDVATYDLKPEMSAHEVTDHLVQAIGEGKYDLLVVNFANGDMVGHTGVFDAAVKAVETLDICLGRVVQAIEEAGGEALITADHGNVEQMMDYDSGQVHTQHTTDPVPLIYVGPRSTTIAEGGVLADIAPTLLFLMGLPVPEVMTGKNLLVS